MNGPENVHVSFTKVDVEPEESLAEHAKHFVQLLPDSSRKEDLRDITRYAQIHGITRAMIFDQPPSQPSTGSLRKGGVRSVVAYWGAPVSSVYPPVLRSFRRIQYGLRAHRPDLYVFETEGMRTTAVNGLGVPERQTSVVPLGVDVSMFRPRGDRQGYTHENLDIPLDRKIIYYSGHFEPRKGIGVLMRAARILIDTFQRRDFHLLLVGNRPGEEQPYASIISDHFAQDHVTFGGYRDDVQQLQAASDIAVICSTGWDSHTMTALEVQASGLPLVVSNLPGLKEAVSSDSGVIVPVGDPEALAAALDGLLADEGIRRTMGINARRRIVRHFSLERQIASLAEIMRGQTRPG